MASYRELAVFVAGGSGAAERFQAIAEAAHTPGSSLSAMRLLLDDCREAISGIYGRLRSADERRRVLDRCLRYADAIAADNASLSYAWYVGALAAAELGDRAGFNGRILQSQITAPNEQWLAALRVSLVEDQFDESSASVLSRQASDLRLLVASRAGIESVSLRYVEDPAFRERITDIVEELPEADQGRFVATIRSLASRAAP